MVTAVLGFGDLLVLDDQRGGEEAEDDEDGNDRVGELQGQVVLALLGNVVALAAIADDRPDDQEGGEKPDDHGADGEALPEVEHRVGTRRRAGLGAKGGDSVLCGDVIVAASKYQGGDGEHSETPHAPPATRAN